MLGNQVVIFFSKNVALLELPFQTQCIYCKHRHSINKCDSFLKLSVIKRMNFVRSNKIFFICLIPFHRKTKCKSTARSIYYSKSHLTLLHF